MKTGAGDDPFAEDLDDGGERESSRVESPEEAVMTGGDRSSQSRPTVEPGPTERASTSDGPEIPWVLRRNSVKGDRDNVHQFFLQDETARGERELRNDVESILDTEVSKLDLREASYLVAMNHPEEIAAVLREWGYEYL